MKKIGLTALLLSFFVGSVGAWQAEAKEKDYYLFLVTITRSTGEQEFIYTDLYVLSGTSTATNVTVGTKSSGSGVDVCDSHMIIAVKGTDGLFVNGKGIESLDNIHRFWNIAWNDKLTILSQKYGILFSVEMQRCPFPLIRMVPVKE